MCEIRDVGEWVDKPDYTRKNFIYQLSVRKAIQHKTFYEAFFLIIYHHQFFLTLYGTAFPLGNTAWLRDFNSFTQGNLANYIHLDFIKGALM